MVDDKVPSDFSYPASPGDYFPPILGDPGEELGSDPALLDRLRARRTILQRFSAQSISNDTFTYIDWDSEFRDDESLWDSSNPDSIFLKPGYTYFIDWQVQFAFDADGYRYVYIEPASSGQSAMAVSQNAVAGSVATDMHSSAILDGGMQPDGFRIGVQHTAGAALNVTFAQVDIVRLPVRDL